MSEFLPALRRRWRVVVALVLIGLASAGFVTQQLTPKYEASAQLFVALGSADDAAELASGVSFTSERVQSYADLVKSPLVLQPVIDELGLTTTSGVLAASVDGSVPKDTVLIEIAVEDTSPTRAADVANAVATNLATVVEDLDRTREDREAPIRLSVTRAAVAPDGPSSPVPVLNLAVGLLLGALVGIGVAYAIDSLDTSVRSEADVIKATGLPMLAVVPTNSGVATRPLISVEGSDPIWSEAYRRLRTNLSFVEPDSPPRVIAVTSAVSGDGKSLTAANLAVSLTQSGLRCLLIDADLRRPSLAKLLGLDASVGVTSVIAGHALLADVIQTRDGLGFLASGPLPPNPSEILGSEAFAHLIRAALQVYDRVIVDTPPLVAVTDAAVVATVMDAVVLVARSKGTNRTDLRKALLSLRAVDAKVVGAVLNQVSPKDMGSYYYGPDVTSPRDLLARRGAESGSHSART